MCFLLLLLFVIGAASFGIAMGLYSIVLATIIFKMNLIVRAKLNLPVGEWVGG